jgi:aryl-alcohol dehydrogenase-like predicted oxidoreductase
VERIDLYQFHWPDQTGVPIEDSWTTMVRLVEEGKVRAAGVSNFNVELLGRCEAIRHVDSLQPPFSLINRAVGDGEIPWCEEHGTGVICYSPMQSGLLTDTFAASRMVSMAADDWRRRSPEFNEPNLSRNLALRDCLRPVAKRHNTSVSSIALGWVLAWQGVTGAIVGARSPQQVEGWIDAARLKLTAQDLNEIAAAVQQTQAGNGPASRAEISAEKAS